MLEARGKRAGVACRQTQHKAERRGAESRANPKRSEATTGDYYIMRIELSPERFDEGIGDFDIGHVLFDTQAERKVKIVKFSGYTEINEEDGTEHEQINVHFQGIGDGVQGFIDYEALERAVYIKRSIKPISPAWFVNTLDAEADLEAEAAAKAAAEEQAEVTARLRESAALIYPDRPVENLTDCELFAKVSGAGIESAVELCMAFEENLARMASASTKHFQTIKGIGKARAEKITAAFELAKRLARFHAEKPKITAPSDVADLMMSKMRYLQKEIVCVLALNTKGGVEVTGVRKPESLNLEWGHKLLNEDTVFEGTLNASVFHPREIFRFAIEECANSIVLVHNHPSGDPQPSQEDIRATKQLIEAGNHIGIKVLDHIVIGDGIFVSLKEEGFI